MFHHDIGNLVHGAPQALAFLRTTLAATRNPVLALQALALIGEGRARSAPVLADCLGVARTDVRRLIRTLVDAGELEASTGRCSATTTLRLTPQGKRTWASLQDASRLAGAPAAGQSAAVDPASPRSADWTRSARSARSAS
jgi:DNA-binding MarR family transcriptional regulator